MSYYAEPQIIKEFAEASEADESPVWEILAEAAARVFDRATEVEENFFAVAGAEATVKSFYGSGTRFLQLAPFVGALAITDTDETTIAADTYRVKDGFIIFDTDQAEDKEFLITALWGFDAVPVDIKLAVVEQALFMWRRKDLSFTEMSGISAATINAQLSPTCEFVANKYKAKYLNYFV